MSRHGSNAAVGTNEWNTSGQGSMLDRFGQNERTGVGARSSFGTRRSDDHVREQLLDELSALRRRHDSLQLRSRSSMIESPTLSFTHYSTSQGASHHSFQGDHPLPPQPTTYYAPQLSQGTYFSGPPTGGLPLAGPAPDDKPVLDQSDKDAIEALFAVDDFAEIFNAGGNVISNLPSMPVHSGNLSIGYQQQRSGLTHSPPPHGAPVCHMCCKKLRPSDVAAYVNTAAFDPSKPTARRASNSKAKPK